MKPNDYTLLEKFPPQNDKDLFDILQFIRKAPFQKDYWHIFKKLYKLTEEALLNNSLPEAKSKLMNMMASFAYRIDQANTRNLQSPYPTHKTLLYMKRRVRRFLRTLGKDENRQEDYFELASKVILANSQKTSINLENQWITMDVLFGNSRRASQKSAGKGGYVLEAQKYNLHQREEKFPEIWNQKTNFTVELLSEKLPWEIKDFAVKILVHNHIKLPELSDETLHQFFASPSLWLKRVATNFSYQVYTYQGLKPEFYAGLWFYANPSLKQKIKEIDNLRPKKSKDWYTQFASYLGKMSINELRLGNNSRRVVETVSFLRKNYGKSIPTKNLVELAPALLQSKHQVLQDLAMTGVKTAKQEDALAWFLALGIDANPTKDKLFDKMRNHFYSLFKKNNIGSYTIEEFVYQESPYAAEFGWLLAVKWNYVYGFWQIWSNLTNFTWKRKIKKEFFHHAITSKNGAKVFLQYYKQYKYLINSMPEETLVYIFEEGLPEIQDFILKTLKSNFISNPLYNLLSLQRLPQNLADNIFEQALKAFRKKELFDYEWGIRNVLYPTQTNAWVLDKILEMLLTSKHSYQSARYVLDCVFELNEKKYITKYLEAIQTWDNSDKQAKFISVLSESNYMLNNAQYFSRELLNKALVSAKIENILELVENANSDNWAKLSEVVYQKIAEQSENAGFWKMILERILNAQNANIHTRLLKDETFYQLFLSQKDMSVLDITESEYEEVLLSWVKNNQSLFKMESGELFKICIHKIPVVRHWALEYTQSQGLTVMFALQLLESNLPDPMQTAKDFFNSIPQNSDREFEAVLALCDSPKKPTRAFALEVLQARKDSIQDSQKLLECLAEHSDALVQNFVATEILTQNIKADFVPNFDKEVLRMRNRSRKAKESIKNRINQELKIDTKTLLELAQSNTKKEAEWAIEVLTKKALAGEEIEGFVLE